MLLSGNIHRVSEEHLKRKAAYRLYSSSTMYLRNTICWPVTVTGACQASTQQPPPPSATAQPRWMAQSPLDETGALPLGFAAPFGAQASKYIKGEPIIIGVYTIAAAPWRRCQRLTHATARMVHGRASSAAGTNAS